jgi:hypothetical protein
MASATPAAYECGNSALAPEERGVRGLHRHVEYPQVANAVIDAVISIRLSLFTLNGGDLALGHFS